MLSGGPPGPHKIQGIGAGFVPPILDRGVIDEIVTIGNQTAFDTARLLRARRGHSGRHLVRRRRRRRARRSRTRPEAAGKNIVLIIPSFAERYLSTALFEGL